MITNRLRVKQNLYKIYAITVICVDILRAFAKTIHIDYRINKLKNKNTGAIVIKLMYNNDLMIFFKFLFFCTIYIFAVEVVPYL